MRLLITLLLTLFTFEINIAQSIAPQSVNNSGTTMNQTVGSLSFTVGELVVLTQTDSLGNSLGGGFTAGATLTTVGIQETDASVLQVNVFPNPLTDWVEIQINHSSLDALIVSITDVLGKELYHLKYNTREQSIRISTDMLLNGTYILSLKGPDNNLLGSYKLIKKY